MLIFTVSNLNAQLASLPWASVLLLFPLAVVVFHVANRYGYGISHVPGPWLASVTGLWRMFTVYKGRSHQVDLELHRKYGPLVRLGPRLISISDPSVIPHLYGVTSKFYKSRFYDAFTAEDEEGIIPDPFILKDRALHSRMKKNGNGAYAMSSIVKMEEFADREISKIFKGWDELYASTGQAFDLGRWMTFYALDSVFALTFGDDFGFLDKREDQFSMMESLEKFSTYGAVVGQMPILHRIIGKTPYLQDLALGPRFSESIQNITKLAGTQVALFKKKQEAGALDPDSATTFVERLLTTQKLNPKSLTDRELNTHTMGNIAAGGDTTSIALRTIFYHLLKHSEVYAKLMDEFEAANLAFPITFDSANSLSYFQAVIREAMRLHPSVGLILGRTVPTGGVTICGKYIPEGTDVGVNPYVVHCDEKVFPDPHAFKPERWLTADNEHLALMNRSYLTFGSGPHTCSGRHISLMEISKLVPSLLLRYDMQLTDKKEVGVMNHWFMFYNEMMVTVKRRASSTSTRE